MVFFLFFFNACLLASKAQVDKSENFVKDSSFEELTSTDWHLHERTSMWTVVDRTDSGSTLIGYSDAVSRTGHRSLFLGPLTPGQVGSHKSIFASQYIHQAGDAVVSRSAPVLLSFWTRGGQGTRSLRARLDISYSDNRFLSVQVRQEVGSSSDEFHRKCVIVANHGPIRALMIHLIVEQHLDDVIFIDDVDVRYIRSLPEASERCRLYTESFPNKRLVVPNFLRPFEDNTSAYEITLATQLTIDRLEVLERSAALWRGPISATILMFGERQPEAMSSLMTSYYGFENMASFVMIHVVWEDQLNRQDAKLYPVNFLRNIAIAHARTSHVFYVDVDIVSVYPESHARACVKEFFEKISPFTTGSENTVVGKYALLVPVFNSKFTADKLPRNKQELLRLLGDSKSGFEPNTVVSHAVVEYPRWYDAVDAYKVDYMDNMEPYFIVTSSAPVLSDYFRGYGRDKCAYSRDLQATGYEFYVLPEMFLVNVLDRPGTQTIYRRSNGLRLDVFLNDAFHRGDIESRFFRHPVDYNADKTVVSLTTSQLCTKINIDDVQMKGKTSQNNIKSDTTTFPERHFTESLGRSEMGGGELNGSKVEDSAIPDFDDGGIGCNALIVGSTLSSVPEMTSKLTGNVRKDTLIEELMNSYGVTTYVEFPSSAIVGILNVMLTLMQPDAVVVIKPETGDGASHVIDGIFETYTGSGDLSALLDRMLVDHTGPKLYSLVLDSLDESKALELTQACFVRATDDDVILFDPGTGSISDSFQRSIRAEICRIKPNWKIYRKGGFMLLKARSLQRPPPIKIPPFPACLQQPTITTSSLSSATTDVIIFTKDRPLQTFAFFDSLRSHVKGVNHVWMVTRFSESIFEEGYALIMNCFSSTVPLTIVRETEAEKNSFGKTILRILNSSTADCVMFAVDELIWIRPVDLRLVSSLLSGCAEDDVGAFQLRLGENLKTSILGQFDERRFKRLDLHWSTDDAILGYYPRRLAFDFGYVLNVDGLVTRRRDLIDDLGEILPLCASPGCLENSWIRRKLDRRSRQWQMMYSSSRVTNNACPEDKRVAGRATPSEGGYSLARRFVEQREKIDVAAFAAKYVVHSTTHTSHEVEYMPLDCGFHLHDDL